MPEGHTIHRLARTLSEMFAGEALAVTSPQGRFSTGAALLDGLTMGAAQAWGKQLVVPFGAQPRHWLRVHLGLYGAWTFGSDGSRDVVHAIGAPRKRVGESETTAAGGVASAAALFPLPPRGKVRLRLLGEHAVADLTGPTACEVLTPPEKDAVLARLGPDPLRPDAELDQFRAALGRTRSPIATLLMDQSVVAGVGNIYRAEALFRAGVAPMTPGRILDAALVAALWGDLVELMRDGARTGRIVTTRPEDRDAAGVAREAARGGRRRGVRQNTDNDPEAVPRDESFYVYQREGLPCRMCATPIAMRMLGGRKLYWCPGCQR